MLPGMDGFDVLRHLRAKSNVPALMLTGVGEEADRIVGLEMGADDYLPKIFSTRELLARLRAVVRRTRSARPVQPKDRKSLWVSRASIRRREWRFWGAIPPKEKKRRRTPTS